MRLIFIISIFTLLLQAQDLLLINSNAKVQKYQETASEFGKSFNKPFKTIDISTMTKSDIKEYLYDEYPDIVYAVGVKAYQYATRYIPEKTIFFSSIMNFKRLPVQGKRFGVSNELHSGMKLILVKSVFKDIKSIGIIYSKYTKHIVEDFATNAEKLGIKIISKKVDKDSMKMQIFDDIVNETEAMLIIPDPLFLSDEKAVKKLFELSKKSKKPVFAYHKLFIKYGASLVTSVDNPTIGRQVATMINSYINTGEIQKIQYPAGTKVIFNKKIVTQMEIEFNSNISFIANEVIE